MLNPFPLKVVLALALFSPFLLRQGETIEPEKNSVVSVYRAPYLVGENGSYSMVGLASWYSKRSPGIKKRTANNEIFDEDSLTCAIWGREFNSLVKVTNLANGRTVVLRVNDRGPHGRYFRKGRIIDLTKAAFQKLSDSKHGLIQVKVEFL